MIYSLSNNKIFLKKKKKKRPIYFNININIKFIVKTL